MEYVMKNFASPVFILLSLVPNYCLSGSLSDTSPSKLNKIGVVVPENLVSDLKNSEQNLKNLESRRAIQADIAAAEADVAAKKKAVEDAKKEPCKLVKRDKDFCRVMFKDTKYFEDVAIDPTLTEGSELKVGIVRGYIDFGERAKLPISILYSKVSDTPEDGGKSANAKTLLDPEQGINFAYEYGGLFSVGELCRGETTARCFIGANIGARYLELKEDGTDTKSSSYGGLASVKMLYAFNILDSDLNADNKLGTIKLDVTYSAFFHNGDDSNKFFAGITDGQGNPAEFDTTFSSLKLGAAFSINKSISVNYARFSANKSSGIKDEESITVSFDGINF
jgi:hypothetical protein